MPVELKELYECRCARCNERFLVAPGTAMVLGYNSRHGRCLHCKADLHMEIEDGLGGERMVSEMYGEWASRTGYRGCPVVQKRKPVRCDNAACLRADTCLRRTLPQDRAELGMRGDGQGCGYYMDGGSSCLS
ncbi:hypothetical protein [Desulfovibrio oxyclinae]|jgi:hypothetical protein|uniref:hypothetical protein n=1 Tax=Desulfovibrio oxyclinae TaxID=63560 RepID=UPI00036C5049|nr:hypothetical protein [Desulfovibrio oxyclinae]